MKAHCVKISPSDICWRRILGPCYTPIMSNANPRAREAEMLRAVADALEAGRTQLAAQGLRLLAGMIDGTAPAPAPSLVVKRKGQRGA